MHSLNLYCLLSIRNTVVVMTSLCLSWETN
jgi:hypothetical protein